ncbi:hypothetical protein Tcan_04108 [Toxocara canis]|uniref:Uncharacterized protein n=1 Tax=Toxocara canis TaxID=6265 RepID=A0A0B2VKI7_TOXCA|nr:hypothetical protein Tcan_04108 [Toxocara canis]
MTICVPDIMLVLAHVIRTIGACAFRAEGARIGAATIADRCGKTTETCVISKDAARDVATTQVRGVMTKTLRDLTTREDSGRRSPRLDHGSRRNNEPNSSRYGDGSCSCDGREPSPSSGCALDNGHGPVKPSKVDPERRPFELPKLHFALIGREVRVTKKPDTGAPVHVPDDGSEKKHCTESSAPFERNLFTAVHSSVNDNVCYCELIESRDIVASREAASVLDSVGPTSRNSLADFQTNSMLEPDDVFVSNYGSFGSRRVSSDCRASALDNSRRNEIALNDLQETCAPAAEHISVCSSASGEPEVVFGDNCQENAVLASEADFQVIYPSTEEDTCVCSSKPDKFGNALASCQTSLLSPVVTDIHGAGSDCSGSAATDCKANCAGSLVDPSCSTYGSQGSGNVLADYAAPFTSDLRQPSEHDDLTAPRSQEHACGYLEASDSDVEQSLSFDNETLPMAVASHADACYRPRSRGVLLQYGASPFPFQQFTFPHFSMGNRSFSYYGAYAPRKRTLQFFRMQPPSTIQQRHPVKSRSDSSQCGTSSHSDEHFCSSPAADGISTSLAFSLRVGSRLEWSTFSCQGYHNGEYLNECATERPKHGGTNIAYVVGIAVVMQQYLAVSVLLALMVLLVRCVEDKQPTAGTYNSRGSAEEMKCPKVGSEEFYTPLNGLYCVYAIGFTAKGAKDEILYNDETNSYADRLEAVTIATCKTDSLNTTKFGGGCMSKSNGRRDVFFACCKNCSELVITRKKALLKLMNMFIAYSHLNVRKVYEAVNKRGARAGVVYKEKYILTLFNDGRQEDIVLPICLTDDFQIAPSLLNSPVCWAKVKWEGHCEICGKSGDKEYLNMNREQGVRHFTGPYDQRNSEGLERIQCTASNNSMAEDVCRYWDTHNSYNMECCCYGSDYDRLLCQSRLIQGGRGIDGKETNCAVRTLLKGDAKSDIETVAANISAIIKNHSQSIQSRETSKEESFAAIHGTFRSTSSCGTHLLHVNDANETVIYAHEQKQPEEFSKLRLFRPKCEDLFVSEPRLQDIYSTQCYPAMPLNSMCPLGYEEHGHNGTASIICCCDDESFCNYRADMRARTLYKPPPLCKYNNGFQQLFNKYVIKDSIKHHSCLVHYANADVIRGVTSGFVSSAQTLNVLPGAPLIPIDYSYAFLNDTNKCGYVEAVVNSMYLSSRECKYKVSLDTKYLPLKLFVCRCKTKYVDNVPCDENLTKNIEEMEARQEQENSTAMCVVYETTSLSNATNARIHKIHNNRISGACQTVFTSTDKGRSHTIAGGDATADNARQAQVPLAHIAYAMYEWSGDISSRCGKVRGGIACFCRSYVHGVACNSEPTEIKYALRFLHASYLRERRRSYQLMLSLLDYIDIETCLQRGSVATMEYNDVTNQMKESRKCLYRRGVVETDGIICRRGIVKSKSGCVLRNHRLVCCCIDDSECEKLQHKAIQIVNADLYQ